MQPAELAQQCVNAMNFWKGEPEKARIIIVLKKGWKAPPKFPRRELLCQNSGGQNVYSLSAMNVLAWLVANGLVNVATNHKRTPR
jgi:hypothetical protein